MSCKSDYLFLGRSEQLQENVRDSVDWRPDPLVEVPHDVPAQGPRQHEFLVLVQTHVFCQCLLDCVQQLYWPRIQQFRSEKLDLKFAADSH